MNVAVATAENPRAVAGNNNPPPLREILAEKFSAYPKEIETIADRANLAPKEIKVDEQLAVVGSIVKDAREIGRRIEKDRKAEKDPYFQAGKEVDGFFGALVERVERIATVLDARASAYQREKAAEARRKAEAEAAAARAEAERQARIAEEEAARNRPTSAAKHADKAEEAATQAAVAEAAAGQSNADLTRVRSTETGTVVSARTSFAFEITDLAKVDLEALRPYLARADIEKAIRTFIRLNKDSVPLAGVKIFEDVKASYR